MVYKDNLKIEFRAVPRPVGTTHSLEWRISPNQDLKYVKEINVFGLFKIKLHKKYNTSWQSIIVFKNTIGGYLHAENSEYNYLPIFIWDQKDFDFYKNSFKTCGEFFDYIDKEAEKERQKYRKEREKYLKEHSTWY